MTNDERYVRVPWRKVKPGDVLKDPRPGAPRTIKRVSRWGYNLDDRYGFLRPWPRTGRLKVIETRGRQL